MNPYDVLLRPVLSEKSNSMREELNQYMFEVPVAASKVNVASAIEKMFGVKVLKVRTTIRRGKAKRKGNHISQPYSSKNAVVTLEKGTKIPLFEDL